MSVIDRHNQTTLLCRHTTTIFCLTIRIIHLIQPIAQRWVIYLPSVDGCRAEKILLFKGIKIHSESFCRLHDNPVNILVLNFKFITRLQVYKSNVTWLLSSKQPSPSPFSIKKPIKIAESSAVDNRSSFFFSLPYQ